MPDQRAVFLAAIAAFVEDLSSGTFRPGLRIKGVAGAPGVFELTFAPDGRATYEYGPETRPGHARIIWRRVGTHAVFSRP